MNAELTHADYIETGIGAGPIVVLIHASTSSVRQWRLLMTELQDRYHLIAVNMLGYGETPAWTGPQHQSLNDHVRVIAPVVPHENGKIHIVGHSLGGAVAMALANHFGDQVEKLVLLEPNPFYLLKDHGRDTAYAEIKAVSYDMKRNGDAGNWEKAAENFGDYWSGPGSWTSLNENLRAKFISNLKNNYHEWDSVLFKGLTLETWRRTLPEQTMVVSARDTTRTISEIVELMEEACPGWKYVQLSEGGHMAPMSHPDLVNPVMIEFLDGSHFSGER